MREHGRNLDDESFRTLMAEVECIINSRPLTTSSTSDPGDIDPLTPNHILTMKSKVVLPPPGNFQKEYVYLRKRWKRVQYLANVFWSRWRREYAQCLQQRSKWNRPRRDFEKVDLVLIVDERVALNHWPLARIVHTYPDEEGYVRSVKVTTGATFLDRPVDNLILILEKELKTGCLNPSQRIHVDFRELRTVFFREIVCESFLPVKLLREPDVAAA